MTAPVCRREFLGACLAPITLRAAEAGPTVNWPGFRGPGVSGIAAGFRTPVRWDAPLWKAPVPGLGHSSPIIWGNRLFVTTAVRMAGVAPLRLGLYGDSTAADDSAEQKWTLCCLDKRTGQTMWTRVARQGPPRAERHMKATHANTTLATDGRRLVAFLGSEGLYCYDLDGKLQWSQDLGRINVSKYGIGWGYASSPCLFEERIFVQCDGPDNPYLSARRLGDGAELWRVSRKGVCERSWGTPFAYRAGDSVQVVANGWPYIASYDAASGRELWRLRGGGDNPIPTPFAYDGLLYVANAHGGPSPLYAIRPSARGDISLPENATSNEFVAWCAPRNGAYIQTPVAYDGRIYSGTNNGIVKCYDAKSGQKHYEQRLTLEDAGFSASPVAADGKIYWTGEEGNVYVVRAGTRFELLAVNALGESAMATPAISEGVLYFRTLRQILAISG